MTTVRFFKNIQEMEEEKYKRWAKMTPTECLKEAFDLKRRHDDFLKIVPKDESTTKDTKKHEAGQNPE